jgi:hypothetical protein
VSIGGALILAPTLLSAASPHLPLVNENGAMIPRATGQPQYAGTWLRTEVSGTEHKCQEGAMSVVRSTALVLIIVFGIGAFAAIVREVTRTSHRSRHDDPIVVAPSVFPRDPARLWNWPV